MKTSWACQANSKKKKKGTPNAYVKMWGSQTTDSALPSCFWAQDAVLTIACAMVWAWKVCGLHQVNVFLAKQVGMYFLCHQKAPPSNQLPVQTSLLVHSFKPCMHPKCLTQPLWCPCPADIVQLSGRTENISQCANFTCFPALSAPQWLMAMAMALQKPGGQCTCNKEPAVTERFQVCGFACIPREPANLPALYRELAFILLGKVWKHGGKGTTSELVYCSQKSQFKALWTTGCKTDLHCSRCKKKKFKAQSV